MARGEGINGSTVHASAPPSVRYCQLADGAGVAYAELGSGAPLVMLPGWLCHLNELWTHPAAAAARDKLSAQHRLVWYDRLGCGLSSRQDITLSLESDVEQLIAVMDAAGIDRASLIGYSFGGPPAAAFAARYPERVERLIFCSAFARGTSVASQQQLAMLKQIVRMNWGLGSRTLASMLVPNGSSADIRWFSNFQRRAATAEMAARLLDHLWSIDVSALLPQLRVPTLVVHNRDDHAVPLSAGEEIAALVPDARLHIMDGNEHDPFIRDAGSLVEVLLDFVAGREHRKRRVAGAVDAALSQREREVLRHIAAGLPNKVIARDLGIAVSTVERHITNTYNKLGVRGRADATMRAVALGLAVP